MVEEIKERLNNNEITSDQAFIMLIKHFGIDVNVKI